MAFKKLLRQLGTRQDSALELMVIKVDVSQNTSGDNNGFIEGADFAILTRTSSGVLKLTFNRAASRPLMVIGSSVGSEGFVYERSASTSTEVFLNTCDDAGTEVDVDFTITVLGCYK